MASDITPEIRHAIDTADGPVEFVDRERQESFYLIRAELYEKLLATLDLGDFTEQEKIANLQATGRAAGWEEPESDVFDDLEPQ